jgi:predicted DNA-binding transcriptional regulator AlpA
MNLLTTDDVARLTGLTVQWLAVMRMKKIGPRFVKLGRAVRYRRGDIDAWLESCSVPTEQEWPSLRNGYSA